MVKFESTPFDPANADPATLDATFSALADSTRRQILDTLAIDGATSVTTLAEPFDMSLPAVSKHLRVLERAGLVDRTKVGRVHEIRLAPRALHRVSEWILRYEQFWNAQLDSLEEFLKNHPPSETDDE